MHSVCTDLQITLRINKQILGLEVAVDEVKWVQILERKYDLCSVEARMWLTATLASNTAHFSDIAQHTPQTHLTVSRSANLQRVAPSSRWNFVLNFLLSWPSHNAVDISNSYHEFLFNQSKITQEQCQSPGLHPCKNDYILVRQNSVITFKLCSPKNPIPVRPFVSQALFLWALRSFPVSIKHVHKQRYNTYLRIKCLDEATKR